MGQVFYDDFTDPDLGTTPIWEGLGAFSVNGSQQLQLMETVAGQSYLQTSFPSTALNNVEWNFWVKQGFSGSDNNQSRIYLASSGTPPFYTGSGTAGVQGYFVKLGEAGSSDAIKICRDDGTGTTTELLSGTLGFIASSFEVRIRITRDGSGNWNLYADGSGGTNYSWQGTFSDVTYTTTDHFALVCTYTASNSDNFYFDDFYFGDEIVDINPPVINSAVATSTFDLDIQFDEAVSLASAEDENNYNIPGVGAPSMATLDNVDASLVHLTFSSTFPENVNLVLEVTGVADLSDNILTGGSIDFMFFVPSEPFPRAVVFNEILADENPSSGLPEAEFIELFNASEEAFDLLNWQLVNSTSPKVLPSFILQPGSFVILCEDDFADLFDQSIGIASFTALTNSGDSLTLLDNVGNIVDVVKYDIDWYDSAEKAEGGWSLEQVNPFLTCSSESNWVESTNVSGGTPSLQNSVFDDTPDNIVPEVESVNVNSPTSLTIIFSETMDESSISNALFEITPATTLASYSWLPGNQMITISTNSNLENGIVYQISIGGLQDCTGNLMVSVTLNFSLGASPMPGDIIINEILPDPDPAILLPEAEYIELFNRSSELIDLKGCTINDAEFTDQTLIEPGGFLIVADADNALSFLFYENKKLLEDFPGLTNSGLELVLSDPNQIVLDQVSYDLGWYHDSDKDDGGWSLELINPNDPCSSEENWGASKDEKGGTPGEINSIFSDIPDSDSPQLLFVLSEPQESITLIFDDPLSTATLDQIVWTVDGTTIVGANPQISTGRPNELILYYGEMETGVVYHFSIVGVGDCWGNSGGGEGEFAIGEEFEPGDLVINEILSDPYDGGYDYVEIFNRSGRAISLSGWKIANEDNGTIDNVKTILERELVMLPGEYLAVTINASNIADFYPFANTNSIWEMEEFPTYSNDAGTVYLLTSIEEISDEFSYQSEMHFPLLNETNGVSLERLDPWSTTQDALNWHSAAESQGYGTPGYLNSQALSAVVDASQVSLSSEIFSPDNDGYQDVLGISYSLEEPGYTGNVKIFDSAGREVRTLMSNELLGTSGTISWDGFTDGRQALPVGIYVVYFEFFSIDGKVNAIKKPCVLAHRMN